MPPNIGIVEPVAIRDVWPRENADFTPWLQSHIGELDKVLGIGLTTPRSEVGAGDFSIDVVADTNLGDVVIENQFGPSDHRHLGQLVTYLSHRAARRAIWIVEKGRPEHVKAVETLRRDFLKDLFKQARDEGIDSPFKDLSPSIHGILHRHARGSGIVYRVAVNSSESRVVVTNARGRWEGALAVLAAKQTHIDQAFRAAGLQALEWPEQATAGRWAIRYTR